jgi:hypothetical protein
MISRVFVMALALAAILLREECLAADIRNATWGDSMEVVLKNSKEQLSTTGHTRYSTPSKDRLHGIVEVAGKSFWIEYFFHNGQLAKVEYFAFSPGEQDPPSDDAPRTPDWQPLVEAEEVKGVLVKKFGAATQAEPPIIEPRNKLSRCTWQNVGDDGRTCISMKAEHPALIMKSLVIEFTPSENTPIGKQLSQGSDF